jgi:hypothetical protein
MFADDVFNSDFSSIPLADSPGIGLELKGVDLVVGPDANPLNPLSDGAHKGKVNALDASLEVCPFGLMIQWSFKDELKPGDAIIVLASYSNKSISRVIVLEDCST